jgi:hypothetical protein
LVSFRGSLARSSERSFATLAAIRRASTFVSSLAAEIRCMLSGKMVQHKIRVLVGDRVQVELSSADLSRGRLFTAWQRQRTARARRNASG